MAARKRGTERDQLVHFPRRDRQSETAPGGGADPGGRHEAPSGLQSTLASGGPATNDVLKCHLKPLRRADYKTTFTNAQWARLQRTFPQGVCDFSRPGVGQQPPIAPWLTFSAGPGGVPLGPPPKSE